MAITGRILGITGSYGYIGNRLLERLKRSDEFDRIVCTDIISPPDKLPDHFQHHACDIRDRKTLRGIFRESGVNCICHLAFIANPTRDRDFEYDVDVNGTRNVLSVCEELKVKKLVVASSDCAYGFFEGTSDYLDESAPIRSTPGFPYSENKAEIEALMDDFGKRVADCVLVVLRPCMVMGPHANNTTSASMKQAVMIGVRRYDPIMQFVHEDDAAEAFYLAITRDVQEPLTWRLMKGCVIRSLPGAWKTDDFSTRLADIQFGGTALSPEDVALWEGTTGLYPYPLSLNIERIKSELGFKPRFSSIQTIRALLESDAG